jgi:hypothetical protein
MLAQLRSSNCWPCQTEGKHSGPVSAGTALTAVPERLLAGLRLFAATKASCWLASLRCAHIGAESRACLTSLQTENTCLLLLARLLLTEHHLEAGFADKTRWNVSWSPHGGVAVPHVPAGSVDAWVSTGVIDLLSERDMQGSIEEAHRILAPGGRLGLVSMSPGSGLLARLVSSLWSLMWK